MHFERDAMERVHLFRAHVVGLPNVLHPDEHVSLAIGRRQFWLREHARRILCCCNRGLGHQLSPPCEAPASGLRVCFFTLSPAFSVLSTRLGPVMTSDPAVSPLTISMSDSPVIPVV